MIDPRLKHVIPSGGWQNIVGALIFAVGIFAAVAGRPVAGALLAAGGSFMLFGALLGYLHALEAKQLLVIRAGLAGMIAAGLVRPEAVKHLKPDGE